MSYTAQELHERAIVIIDELSDSGSIDVNKTKEYANRAPRLLDMWQKEVAKNGDLYKTFEISCYRKQNLLSEFDSFKMVEHTTADQSYFGIGANCFYFGVDGPATVTFKEDLGGSLVDVPGTFIYEDGTETAFTGTINADTDTRSFRYYKGILTPSSQTSTIYMIFGGDYYYRHMNRALCPYKFASIDKVPDFRPYYKIEMPEDFKSRTQIIDEFPDWQYQEGTHKWEGHNELWVSFGYEGTIRIKYIPIPAKITTLAQTIEVDDVTAMSGAYYLAEHYALADMNSELAKKCRDKFQELKIESMARTPLSTTEIIDVYGLGGD
jgi:hypothetical protein